MRIIPPMTITDAVLTDSNLAEDSTSAWAAGTTYASGDYVHVVSTHRVYRSVQDANTGNDPTTDDGTWWVNYSATNKWKAFDQTISDPVVASGDIEYEFTTSQKCSHLALFGLEAANVNVVVKDTLGTTVYDETKAVMDTSSIVDWYSYFVAGINFETEMLFEDIPAFAGYTVEVTIGQLTGGTAEVGQIVIGQNEILGQALIGTEIGFRSFSIKRQDEFGNLTITQRGYADKANFQYVLDRTDVRRVKRILTNNEATPCVFWVTSDLLKTGTFIYGFFNDASFPLGATKCFATLDVKGLI
jgi:hypothetical protein